MMAQYKLQNLFFEMITFSSTSGYIHEILESDPLAMRAKLQGGLNIWDEIKRINIIFYQNRMNNYINNGYANTPTNIAASINQSRYSNNNYDSYGTTKSTFNNNSVANHERRSNNIADRERHSNKNHIKDIKIQYSNNESNNNPYINLLDHVPTDGNIESNEDYATTMFMSDSLQPEGLEYFNNVGPKYELLENQYDWNNKDSNHKYNSISQKNKIGKEDDLPFDLTLENGGYIASDSIDDTNENYRNEYNILKSMGRPNHHVRTAEDLIYELMGENYVDSSVANRAPNSKQANSGSSNTEFMRYKEIPFWQKPSREGVDTDITETLGFGMKESNTHLRGWNMD